MLSVTYFYREPRKTGVSIEGIFRMVRECLEHEVSITEFYCRPGMSRLQNTIHAGRAAGEINHITGDVNFLALWLRGKKNVLTIHDLGFYENPVHSQTVKFIYRLFWFTLPLKNIDIVTVVSEFTKRKVMEHFRFPEEKIRVIPDPVKPIFQYSERKQFGERLNILMMGTGKHKNLGTLIEALKGTGFHLDIIGWPAPGELDKLVAYNIDHTIYNSLTDEQVYERYIACDILFMASLYEGFGMPIIEAQSVGRPVVTSNIGAMKEIGEGSTILVDPNSPVEIREAILSLRDPVWYDTLVKKGRMNAGRYDGNKIAQQYLAVYKELSMKNG